MANGESKQILRQLAVDVLMALIFLALVGFAIWLLYIYFLRGPIDIETRGFVSRTVRTEVVQPVQVEKYRLKHFHNLDDVVVAGIQSQSLCVTCHTDYPHGKNIKVRSLLNAHSWFMACEVCHVQPEKNQTFTYRWLESVSGTPLTSLNGQPGVYGGMITPLRDENGVEKRLDVLSAEEQEYTEEFIRLRSNLDDYQVKWAQERIHKQLAKKAVFCDGCHTQDGLLKFRQLLYSERRAMHLESLDMASMVSTYKVFHLPTLFDSK